ncbi:MAG: response regulator transcription factor [Defluviitaleaceae bacterium]|nr:response regulator transcription factor [Defluviitaleaceae bacterium]
MKATILLVEDNKDIMTINRETFKMEGFRVMEAKTIAEARIRVRDERPDLIVLDISLPDGNGLELCEEMRGGDNIPIIFLTALGTKQDIIKGFNVGGDDYLPKPYDTEVLVMRVKSLLRRTKQIMEVFSLGPIQVNMASAKASIDGEDMGLQQKELNLLLQFMQQPGKVISVDKLYQKVWGQKMLGQDNALKVAISKLRAKVQTAGYTISSARGEGYYLEKE